MKLKYKILWIEDEVKSILREEKQIKKYLEDDYGFECNDNDVIIKDFDEFENEFVEDNQGIKSVKNNINEFDLLLVDLNLGEDGQTGDILINLIRESKVYSEILFYSSNYEELRSKLDQHFIDGVFTSNRDELEDKIKRLINVTIKKVQDVNNLRGLIMAEVAELDIMKEEIIYKASLKIQDKELEKYTLKKIQESGKSNQSNATKKLADISNITFTSLFEKIGFVDSNKKAMTLGEALDRLKITEPASKETFTQPYIDNILYKRNMFAHVKEDDGNDGEGNPCKVIKDIPFTEANCVAIRKEIKKYKELLRDIEQKLDE